ncbi:MAG: glycerate kinase [Rectinemataceae bacterium]
MMSGNDERLREDARSIFMAGLERVDPAAMMRRVIRLDEEGGPGKERLTVRTELEHASYDLADFDRILVTGFGKASARMAIALEEILGKRISGGVVAVKSGHVEPLEHIALVEASHPVPDASSIAAAKAVLEPWKRDGKGPLNERTLVIVLVSGGGSAIACAPADGISLADKAATTRLLLASGAVIHELNCVRKHLSAIKGGLLAEAYAPATVLALMLSDVIGDDLDTIASGPTVPDGTSFAQALTITRRYGIHDALPAAVRSRLEAGASGALPETPKPGAPAFARVRNILIGTNRMALLAAEARAKKLGYETLVFSSRIEGEAREVAKFFFGAGKDIAVSDYPLRKPACLISGGETTVTIRGHGRGGRNQEMALSFLDALSRAPKDTERMMFLSSATDGNDGPTDAAGAFASIGILEDARSRGLDPAVFLADNDSYAFFDSVGALLRTGPTNTNVCDIQILLVR